MTSSRLVQGRNGVQECIEAHKASHSVYTVELEPANQTLLGMTWQASTEPSGGYRRDGTKRPGLVFF
jgi:hypothetical protein